MSFVQVLRTSLVHNKQLYTLCKELGLDKFIIFSKNEVSEWPANSSHIPPSIPTPNLDTSSLTSI